MLFSILNLATTYLITLNFIQYFLKVHLRKPMLNNYITWHSHLLTKNLHMLLSIMFLKLVFFHCYLLFSTWNQISKYKNIYQHYFISRYQSYIFCMFLSLLERYSASFNFFGLLNLFCPSSIDSFWKLMEFGLQNQVP